MALPDSKPYPWNHHSAVFTGLKMLNSDDSFINSCSRIVQVTFVEVEKPKLKIVSCQIYKINI